MPKAPEVALGDACYQAGPSAGPAWVIQGTASLFFWPRRMTAKMLQFQDHASWLRPRAQI
jgi:hypothetical protein